VSGPLLEVRGLSAGYVLEDGVTKTVRDVSLTVAEGEVLGIAGESGCGKSTLIQSILRILSPPGVITGGQVLYQGTDLLQLQGPELRALRWGDISLVFQQAMNALNPTLTVWDQLRDTLAVSEPPETHEARAAELLEQVEISKRFLSSYPHQLSGGMRQRVVIAIALARRPRLLLMDEPTTALDVVVQRDILRRIRALQRDEGFSVILITHDLPLMLRFADRVAIMYDGEIVERGPARTLETEARHPYTQQLLRAFPSTLGERVRLPDLDESAHGDS
jgi:peptide/nickel transport system ATP-binding protein